MRYKFLFPDAVQFGEAVRLASVFERVIEVIGEFSLIITDPGPLVLELFSVCCCGSWSKVG